MENFSVYDVLLGLNKEKESLKEKWQGHISDTYVSQVMDTYMVDVKNIEMSYEELTRNIQIVRTILDDDDNNTNCEVKIKRR